MVECLVRVSGAVHDEVGAYICGLGSRGYIDMSSEAVALWRLARAVDDKAAHFVCG